LKMSKAWEDLREFFGVEDGSLPDLVELSYKQSSGAEKAFDYLRSLAKSIDPSSTLYDLRRNQSVSISSIKHPVNMVSKGEAEPFCLMLYGLLSGGDGDVPELGVFVFPKVLQFYFRPANYWSSGSLENLFGILSTLCNIDSFYKIDPLLPSTEYYSRVWENFIKHFEEYRNLNQNQKVK